MLGDIIVAVDGKKVRLASPAEIFLMMYIEVLGHCRMIKLMTLFDFFFWENGNSSKRWQPLYIENVVAVCPTSKKTEQTDFYKKLHKFYSAVYFL